MFMRLSICIVQPVSRRERNTARSMHGARRTSGTLAPVMRCDIESVPAVRLEELFPAARVVFTASNKQQTTREPAEPPLAVPLGDGSRERPPAASRCTHAPPHAAQAAPHGTGTVLDALAQGEGARCDRELERAARDVLLLHPHLHTHARTHAGKTGACDRAVEDAVRAGAAGHQAQSHLDYD